MEDSTKTLEVFYRRLLKSPLKLEERERIRLSIVESVRSQRNAEWLSISKSLPKFKSQLKFLANNGYLSISHPVSLELAKDISRLPRGGRGNNLRTGNEEVEALSGVININSVQSLVNDKALYQLVSLYLGAPARIYSVSAAWQYPMPTNHKPSNAQLWHRDRDDFAFLKLFLYGSDVDKTCGPHAFIPRTHNSKSSKEIFKSSQKKYESIIDGSNHQFFNDDLLKSIAHNIKPLIWVGPKATCFLEDTNGFHRAYMPTKKPRLLFQIIWTLGPGFDPDLYKRQLEAL